MHKIGVFLSQLRKEQNLTQEQLGEKLGVTNKTVSRWETGTYLPPVEMLQELSVLYGISINEILSAQRLPDSQFREKAEENIRATLRASSFSLKEKTEFYKAKWKHDHLFGTVFGSILCGLLMVAGFYFDNGLQILGAVLTGFFGIWRNNEMMTYVEQRAFDGTGAE